jgi:amino acid transporter
MQLGALLSVYGNLSSQMLNVPRITFALAERGDFPSIFAAFSRKFRTPHVSIATFAVIVFLFALAGSFRSNAVLSAVARLLTYGVVCMAVMALRRKYPHTDAFRLPAGPVVSGVGLIFVLALVTQLGVKEIVAIAAVMGIALLNWIWVNKRQALSR